MGFNFALPVVDKIVDIADKFIPDKTKKLELKAALKQQVLQGEFALLTGQMEVNKEEAKHKSMFVAGWRPFIGWICGVSFAYKFIIFPILASFGLAVVAVDMTLLMPLAMGMLGLRTFEKHRGVSTEAIGELETEKKGFFSRFKKKKS